MTVVFLSYSHDSDQHSERVRGLAERLRQVQGLSVRIDRDCWPGGPDEGWPNWSERQVREADRVLVVCTETWARRYDGDDDDVDRGHGTVAEARAIRQFLYASKGVNARFRVVLFDEADAAHVPVQLAGYHRFVASDAGQYAQMVAWLAGAVPDSPGRAPPDFAWPEPDPAYPWTLADRKNESALMRDALSGRSPRRIFLFEGGTNTGKTALLGRIAAYAGHIGVAWARFDFKGTLPLEDLFGTLKLDLGRDILPATHRAAGARPSNELLSDLQDATSPVLLIFDTYEQASEDSRRWIEGRLLSRVDRVPGLVVVIGGQKLPEYGKYPWEKVAEIRKMSPIDNQEDWIEYSASEFGRADVPRQHVQAFIDGTNGNPGMIRALIENTVNRLRAENP